MAPAICAVGIIVHLASGFSCFGGIHPRRTTRMRCSRCGVTTVLHQFQPAHRRRRLHSSQTRDRGNGVRGSDRRATRSFPSDRFGANSAWVLCAVSAYNLPRAGHRLQRKSRHGPWCDTAPASGQRPCPIRQAGTRTSIALAHPWLLRRTSGKYSGTPISDTNNYWPDRTPGLNQITTRTS